MDLKTPVPIEYVNFGIAGGVKYRLVCKHHPENGYRTKNPWGRSIFTEAAGKDCPCPVDDLLVTHIPEELTDEPFGGRHFKKGMPAEFAPEPVTVHLTVQQQG
ncbi:hypothetical protein Achl_3941 (plasmid) [Pseudarthrobacter chlorophenolicus A6]|uniref:Uncharacterized protein n=1 Tax=Pseudarthrobacter chlorophenolicus (strain ATCC 700700 / DSM 12829 / CIP 107037 / JCM 12360 / KCTC 9906 / NCIMB 13794 / A6) TaxID=452863 RepID=B8HHJ5_PSECP|nr:hypothetical protein [Pseudarthrobacter chlorophenolicus]ACL41892.1 hypothetical protein Achl_3941 [Pseudarthrobacter chlorophenolicus A6]SDQ18257.1 hypothetical protein SAMN04489738_0553 [Pseudarthrobacter chlorophenolicus]